MSIVNGYTLIEPSYKGGMAVVYKGQNGDFTRAFKMIRPDKAANNARLCEQFFKEIKIQAKLDHPNIIKILGAYPYTDNAGVTMTVLEMEWLDGMDLQRFIEQKSPSGLDSKTICKIAMQVINGMEYAHEQSILHLDIKPSNLFRTKTGYIKIIDFGIARLIGENADIVNDAGKTTVTSALTGESTFKGTLAYASPEQQVGGKLGFPSDIYSFGKTLHFLCTGTTDPSAEVKDTLLAGIITKCTAQNPKHRFQTFGEVREAFSTQPEETKCPKCHSSVRKTAKFCPECGYSLQNTEDQDTHVEKCPKCGKTRMSNDRFCENCGWDFQRTKVITGYRCMKCNQTTRAYADGNVNYCNHCGATKKFLTPLYHS